MNAVGVGVDKPSLVFAMIVELCSSDCEVTSVGGYCRTYWDVSRFLVMLFYLDETERFVLFDVSYLEAAVCAGRHLTV